VLDVKECTELKTSLFRKWQSRGSLGGTDPLLRMWQLHRSLYERVIVRNVTAAQPVPQYCNFHGFSFRIPQPILILFHLNPFLQEVFDYIWLYSSISNSALKGHYNNITSQLLKDKGLYAINTVLWWVAYDTLQSERFIAMSYSRKKKHESSPLRKPQILSKQP
jgi:hypothetical protein